MTKEMNYGMNQTEQAEQTNLHAADQSFVEIEDAEEVDAYFADAEKDEDCMIEETSEKKGVKASTFHTIGPDVSAIQAEEIDRMVSDPRYHATPIPGTCTAVINLTEARKAGIEIYRMKDNRTHGKDQDRTGESIMNYGAQIPLSVIPVMMARAANIELERFPNDPNKDKPISEDGLGVLEGHGRMGSQIAKNVKEWPTILAVLPMKDKNGEIHVGSAYIEINKNDTLWKTSDYLYNRTSEPDSHQGWEFIKALEKKGFSFTVATIFVTGRENVITKKTVLNPDADVAEIFKNYKHAMKIYEACDETFTHNSGSAILTKQLPNKIFSIWNELKDTSFTADQATDYLVNFIRDLKTNDGRAAEINSAKKAGDRDRDTVRKEKLSQFFEEYKATHPID